MPIAVTCRGCRKTFQVKDALNGKKIRCPKCSEVFTVRSKSVDDEPDMVEMTDDDEPDMMAVDDDEEESFRGRKPPQVQLQTKSGKKRKRQKNFVDLITPEMMLTVFLVMLTAGTVALLFILPQLAHLIAYIIIAGGILMAAVGAIQARSMTMGDDSLGTRVLIALFPPYSFMLILGRWSELMPYSLMFVLGLGLSVIGFGLERTARHFEDQYQRQLAQRQHEQMFGRPMQHGSDASRPVFVPPVQQPQPAPRSLTEEERRREEARAKARYKLSDIEDSTVPATAETQFKPGDIIYVNFTNPWEKCEVLSLNKIGQPVVKFAGNDPNSSYTIEWKYIRVPK